MGDQIGSGGASNATLVPPGEAERLRAAEAQPHEITAAFAVLARVNTLGMIHLAGSGHIGSSFSSLDLVTWLHLEHLADDDVYFSSKGHDVPGLYSVLLALGRLDWDLVTQLRRLNGLPGHPDTRTPGIAFNTGSLGMGISKAKGLVRADRLAGRRRRLVVMTGDGELQEGQIWESLATAARDRMAELTVVVDHNRLQSDLPVAQVSDLGDLEAKFTAFGWDVSRCDGHDLDRIADAFGRSVDGPLVVIATTVKGAGVARLEHTARPADERFYPFHSGALADDTYAVARDELLTDLESRFESLGLGKLAVEEVERAASPSHAASSPPQRLLDAYGHALVEAGHRRDDLVVLDADLMIDCRLTDFADTFPDRFVECGIAEQDMVSQAGGLAAGGMLPVVNSFGAFLSQRPSEQIANNASESRKIIYMGALAGLIPAAPGHSHQATRDIASFGSVDGLTVIAPSTERQVADAVAFATSDQPDSVYLRLCSLPVEVPFDAHPLPPAGQGAVLHQGSGEVIVVGYGPVLLTEAFEAVTGDPRLRAEVTLIDLPWVTAFDDAWLVATLLDAKQVVVLDDHSVRGGCGERLVARAAVLGAAVPCEMFGVVGLPECGQPADVLTAHGLDRNTLRTRLRGVAGGVREAR